LFAVGRGGNPARHHHLLQTMARASLVNEESAGVPRAL
jgi:hypothetical protein